MRKYATILLLFTVLSGCVSEHGQTFSVFFQPYSADLDPRAQVTVHAAAAFAKAHPLMPLSIPGYSRRPYPGNLPDLRQQRVAVVLRTLTKEGVDRWRIGVLGEGLLYPDGVPGLEMERVDINIGL
ncbi:MAG TPA: hypothetical protein DDZ81_22315 [Acetobacteraceae bacterium]|jgi:hypothetical protein|nr:hypothetical protein [Acetobacteraceae bacterium]